MYLKRALSCYSIILLLLLSCEKVLVETITDIPIPTYAQSSEPNLHKSKDGTIYLSWIESEKGGKSALKFSTLTEDMTWSEPNLIAQGSDCVITSYSIHYTKLYDPFQHNLHQ